MNKNLPMWDIQMCIRDRYIVDVQIRDMIAEKYQGDTTKDLSNHIVTYTETVGIN